MEEIEVMLKKKGYKLTPQRLAIANYLKGNTQHPTVARIYEDLRPTSPSMSIATVYNTLRAMTKIGVVDEHKMGGEESHFDPDTTPHHHFCCRRCRAIFDLPAVGEMPSFAEFEKKTKNRVDHVSVVLSGVCQRCLKKKQPASNKPRQLT